ncbi:hypothetical protein CSA56_13035 [candidate division KSB3 bacterium]|uniref:ATP-grasp domain-containing protein n=1 Tax=candidate division KSB3 bacterium TaxID=2044937 RepID=A0A2G6KBQ0_9BACT|nr:MAG: hypothetical protein CSA56_13035 [candidate division KSB3 bacterium]
MKKTRTYAVVIGLGSNGLANARALGQHGIAIIIFLSSHEATEVYAATRYGRQQIVDVTDGPAILRQLHALPENANYVLFLTTDYQVRYLSEHRDDLPENCILQAPEKQVVDMLLHKDLFDDFCRSHDFPVPQVAMVRGHNDVREACQNLVFPVIAKTLTKSYKSGLQKAYTFEDAQEVASWYDSMYEVHRTFIFQEFIPGTDHSVFFTMQYISATGELLASFTGRKIRQWRPLNGGTASAEPAYNEYLRQLTYDFFRKVNFCGIGSMEYKQDSRTGKFYMIEPTVCRTDFQEGVAIANAVNIPMVAYRDICGQDVQPVFLSENSRKAWMHVLNDRLSRDWYISQKELTYSEWLASLRHVRSFDAFAFHDPGPFLQTIRKKFETRLGKFLKS